VAASVWPFFEPGRLLLSIIQPVPPKAPAGYATLDRPGSHRLYAIALPLEPYDWGDQTYWYSGQSFDEVLAVLVLKPFVEKGRIVLVK